MEQPKQKIKCTLDALLLEQVDFEIAEPTGYVSPRDPKDHVSLTRMKERLKQEGFDTNQGIPSGLLYELACRSVRLNNDRRARIQAAKAKKSG